MIKEKIIIVNDKDEIIEYKQRGTLKQTDIYRVSALWVQNSKGDILLAQRSFNKKNNPGQWGPAVAGTNDKGESYKSNIIKEAKEEIGLENYPFQKSFYKFTDGEFRYFVQWFFVIIDKEIKEFTLLKEEVEKIKWFSKKELNEELDKYPDKFLKNMKKIFDFFNK